MNISKINCSNTFFSLFISLFLNRQLLLAFTNSAYIFAAWLTDKTFKKRYILLSQMLVILLQCFNFFSKHMLKTLHELKAPPELLSWVNWSRYTPYGVISKFHFSKICFDLRQNSLKLLKNSLQFPLFSSFFYKFSSVRLLAFN